VCKGLTFLEPDAVKIIKAFAAKVNNSRT